MSIVHASQGLLGLLVLAALLLTWNALLHGRVAARTRQLQQEQDRLARSEARFRHLFEQTQHPALVMDNDRIADANRASLQMMRMFRLDQLLGLSAADISPPRQPDGRDSTEKAAEMIRLAHERGTHEFEWEHLRADGESFAARVMLTPIEHDGRELLYVLWRDISDEKRIARELSQARETAVRLEQQQRLASLLEQDIVGVAQGDAEGRYTQMNDHLCAMLGRSRAELLGHRPFEVTHPDNVVHLRRLHERLRHTRHGFVDEQEFVHVSGRRYWLQLAFTLHLDPSGRIDSHMMLALDVTQRKRQERQILQLNAELEAKVESRTAELMRANEELRQLARLDALTGLANRLAANERRQHEFVALQRSGRPYAVLLIDIDHFKRINDGHGHPIGDRVLQQIAQLLKGALRESDFVARWGGEEFLVLLPETGREQALRVGEKLRAAIEAAPDPDAGRVTISLGLAIATRATRDPDSPVIEADACLYEAKRSGRNQIVTAGSRSSHS